MKKTILLIAAALLLCSEMKAQDLAEAFTLTPAPQLSLADNLLTDNSSIFSLPMPTSDLVVNNQFNTQEYASRKGWGIFCIVFGGINMLSGASVWLFGDMFNNVGSQIGNMSDIEDDPDMQQGQQAVQTVGNTVKTVGIIGTVFGAAMVGTGIWLVSSDSGSSRGRGHRGRGHRRSSHRRHSELLPDYNNMQPDWGLCLNVAPASAGLSFVF